MGCAAATSTEKPVTNCALDQSDLDALDNSFDTWRWNHLPKGRVGTPTRRLHEKHLMKLDQFAADVDKLPMELSFEIQKRRAELSQAGPLEGGILVSMSL